MVGSFFDFVCICKSLQGLRVKYIFRNVCVKTYVRSKFMKVLTFVGYRIGVPQLYI